MKKQPARVAATVLVTVLSVLGFSAAAAAPVVTTSKTGGSWCC